MAVEAQSCIRFLIDADVSWRLGAAISLVLDHADVECVGRDRCDLDGNAKDDDVHRYAQARDRVLISKDASQLGQLPTAEIIRQGGSRVIYVTDVIPDSDPRLQVIWFLQEWPKLTEAANNLQPGEIIKIRKNGSYRKFTVNPWSPQVAPAAS